MADDKKVFKFDESKTVKSFTKSQETTNQFEAFQIGWMVPFLWLASLGLLLMMSNFIAWLMPEMPHGWLKVLVLGLTAFLAATALPSRISFLVQAFQCSGEFAEEKKKGVINKDHGKIVDRLINGFKFKMFFQTLILAAIVAGYHYFCIEIIISTFTSIEHTEKLGVLEAANAYMAFGFMMIIGDVLIHLFIGANTKIELDYNIFKANYAELLKIKEMAIVHKQYEIAQLDVDKRFKALQHEYDNLVKQAQQAQQNKGGNSGSGGNSGGGGGSGTTPPAINPTLDPTKVPNWQKSDIEIKARIQGAPKFWSKMLDNTVTENDINGMIQKANRSTLAGAFGTELASLESQMRGLLDEGIQKWSTDSKAIWEKMVDVKSKFMALYQKHK